MHYVGNVLIWLLGIFLSTLERQAVFKKRHFICRCARFLFLSGHNLMIVENNKRSWIKMCIKVHGPLGTRQFPHWYKVPYLSSLGIKNYPSIEASSVTPLLLYSMGAVFVEKWSKDQGCLILQSQMFKVWWDDGGHHQLLYQVQDQTGNREDCYEKGRRPGTQLQSGWE